MPLSRHKVHHNMRGSMTVGAALLLIVLLNGTGFAQEADLPHGVIRIGLSEFYQQNGWDAALSELIQPVLLERGPADQPVFAAPGNQALIASSTRDGNAITLRVRDDATWLDGIPFSAYDVAYAILGRPYRGLNDDRITTMQVDDPTTLTIVFNPLTCASLAHLIDEPVQPAHLFSALADEAHTPHMGRALSMAEWRSILSSAAYTSYEGERLLYTSYGHFRVQEINPLRARLAGTGQYASLSVEAAFLPEGITPVDAFMTGETNLLALPTEPLGQSVPSEAISSLRAAAARGEIALNEVMSDNVVVLVVNFADPDSPRDGVQPDGSPEAQGVNPLMSDPAVREALALAIDRSALIRSLYNGMAVPIGLPLSPTSWAYSERPTDRARFDQAAAVLANAGWADTDRNGIRECVTCTTVEPGTPLILRMADDGSPAGGVLGSFMQEIGIGLGFGYTPGGQDFDIALMTLRPPAGDPDLGIAFATAGDRLHPDTVQGVNVGSYDNPQVAAWLAEAADPNENGICPVETRPARAALIQQALDLAVADHAIIPLITPITLAAARGIDGFSPRHGDTFNGLENWQITDLEGGS